MDVSHSLLVALMFITILSMGIGNILTSLAEITRMSVRQCPHGLHIGWVVLLMLVHLRMFWFTIDVLSVERWAFAGFLGMLSGPILLFFAAGVVLAACPGEADRDKLADFFRESSRFFVLFAILQLWYVGLDLVFGRGLTLIGYINIAMFGLFVLLAAQRRYAVHTVGLAIAWITAIVSWLLESPAGG